MKDAKHTLIQSCLIGGLCLASLHLTWIVLVLLDWAQPLMDFIFKLHMLNSPFQIQAFNWEHASSLIAITFAIGALYGLIFHIIQNAFTKIDKELP